MTIERSLRSIFGNDYSLFVAVCNDGGFDFIRYGYDSPDSIWQINPTINFL